jgi:DNA-binding Lrp family transcriptional regulator
MVAGAAGLSASQCSRRRTRLEEEKVILGYHASLTGEHQRPAQASSRGEAAESTIGKVRPWSDRKRCNSLSAVKSGKRAT